MIGKTIQNIEITSLLGKGGMGTVYKGTDVMLKRDVAIKVLHPELLYDDQVTKRFQSEAIMLASLNHTNITSLFNLIKSEGNFMMVMEFVDGRSLEDMLLEKKRFSEEESIEFIQQALDGLKHAHEKSIIHRDLKLANIMVSNEGIVKVMDFGIARVLGSSRLTSSGRVIGTLEYMSPEQVRGEEGDERSDIYALGTVLYEMVAGRVPFKSASDYDLMTTKLNQKPPSIRSFVETDSALDSILNKAMSIDPKNRYQTAEQFQQALADYQKKHLIKSTKPKQKQLSAAALIKAKKLLGDGKEIKEKLQKTDISRFPGLLIEKFNKNRKILIQALAAACCCILLLGVALKIRKTRLDGRSSDNNTVMVDSLDWQNIENSESGQNSIIYPEPTKIDPTTLPKSGGSDQDKKEDKNNKDNSDKQRVNETSSEKPKTEPAENQRTRKTNKAVNNKNNTKPADKTRKSKSDKADEKKTSENIDDETKQEEDKMKVDSTGEKDFGEKVESVSDKINQTGKKLLKDFKEILFDENEEKEQKEAKKDEAEKVEEKKQEPQTVYIQAYTTIIVRLSEAVSSENAKQGQPVKFSIDQDVLVDGIAALKAGQGLSGKITEVKPAEGSKKGILEITITSISTSGNQSIPLRASTFRVIGEKGQDVVFQPGQTFEVQSAQRSKIIVDG